MARDDDLRGLRTRWQSLAEDELRSLCDRLLNAAGPVVSPFGATEGREDLRGLSLTSATLGRVGRLSVGDSEGPAPARPGVLNRWSGLDFTAGDLADSNWIQLEITDCVFDDAKLENLRCWGVLVKSCSFRRANLHHSQLGASAEFWPNRAVWENDDLSHADLRRATASARFEQVNFANAKFTGTDFAWSDLVDCTFRGIVYGLSIGRLPVTGAPRQWRLAGVNMADARPRRVRFQGVNFGDRGIDISLPEDIDHWHVDAWPQFLVRVAAQIAVLPEGMEKTTAQIWLDYATRESGPRQTTGFIATRDVTDFGGQPLLDLLAEARL